MPREFTVKDAGGEEIVVFVEHGVFETSFVRKAQSDGRLPGLRTEDGRYVNYLAKGKYEIVDDDGNIPVKSDDPEAP